MRCERVISSCIHDFKCRVDIKQDVLVFAEEKDEETDTTIMFVCLTGVSG